MYQLFAMAFVFPGPKFYSACLWCSLQTCFTNNSPFPNRARSETCLERCLGLYSPQGLPVSLIGITNAKWALKVQRNHTSYSGFYICLIWQVYPFFVLQEASFLFLIFLFFDVTISVPFCMIMYAYCLY